jgi:hypothetical protein
VPADRAEHDSPQPEAGQQLAGRLLFGRFSA